jgi:hypothetical protein
VWLFDVTAPTCPEVHNKEYAHDVNLCILSMFNKNSENIAYM